MPLTVKKKTQKTDTRLDHLLTGDVSEFAKKDKLIFMKKEFKVALATEPDYGKYISELQKYFLEIPTNPEVERVSRINEIYAEAQSYFSRATAIGMIATDNASRWRRIQNAMEEYIEDRESELLTQDEIQSMRNSKLQQAEVRKRLIPEYKGLRKVKMHAEEAQAFSRIVEAKKKDLQLVMTTLAKQVKALALEYDHTKRM